MPKKEEPRMTYTEANKRLNEYFIERRAQIRNSKMDMSAKSIKLVIIKDEERHAKEIIDMIFGY